MSKAFDLTPVFGPAVSVRHHGSPSFQRRPSSFAASQRAHSSRRAGKSKLWMGSKLFRGAMRASAMYGVLVMFGLAAVSYIFLINSSAAKGYEMKKIQNRIQEQSEINHSLEIKAAQMASLGAIDQAAESASLVSIKGEEFLAPATVTALKTTK